MKDLFLAFLSGIKKPIDGRLRNRFSVFLVCLAISMLMWGLIKLTREYETPVKYHIQPDELPEGRILIADSDSVLTLNIIAKGFDLYSGKLFRHNKVIHLNLSKIRLKREGETYTGVLRTAGLVKVIAAQLPSGSKLISIDPDTLHFAFKRSYRRKIPVHSQLSLDFDRQHQLYDSLRIRPDSVWIRGVKEIIDTISFINTEKRIIRKLNTNLSLAVKLITPTVFPAVSLSRDSVWVTINVEKFTEADIEVPVGLYVVGKEVSYRTFPEKVRLTCRIAMRDYKRLDPSVFSVLVDYDKAIESGNNRVPVEVKRKPSFVKVVKIEPEKVEFLILK